MTLTFSINVIESVVANLTVDAQFGHGTRCHRPRHRADVGVGSLARQR